MEHVIRPAEPGDAEAMGAVHVRSWQAAYRGMMPDAYLDGLRTEDRAQLWRDSIPRTNEIQRILVGELDGTVVGFAAFGRESGGAEGVGELYSVNLDPEHWGRGLGRTLLVAVTDGLRAAGFGSAVLWVVPENARARGLYESEGWTNSGETRDQDVLGVTVPELRYERDLGG